MRYTCLNCGSSAHRASELCNPTSDILDANFCATATDVVCEEHRDEMQYTCTSCGGMAGDAEHLCMPVRIR